MHIGKLGHRRWSIQGYVANKLWSQDLDSGSLNSETATTEHYCFWGDGVLHRYTQAEELVTQWNAYSEVEIYIHTEYTETTTFCIQRWSLSKQF